MLFATIRRLHSSSHQGSHHPAHIQRKASVAGSSSERDFGSDSRSRELAEAQLRITQLLATPEVAVYERIIASLDASERDMRHEIAEFRYTKMAMTALYDSMDRELRRVLEIAGSSEKGEFDAVALKASAEELLKSNIGFRSDRVCQVAPLITAKGSTSSVGSSHNIHGRGESVLPPSLQQKN